MVARPAEARPADASKVEELIARCVAGDDQAKARFYDTYIPLIRRSVQRQLGRTEYCHEIDEEDLCHEIVASLFENNCRRLAQLHKPKSIDAWLMTIAQNHVRSHVRRLAAGKERHATFSENREEANRYTPEAEAIDNESQRELEEKLAVLSDEERLILELYFMQGLRYTAIANMLGLNINTVASKLRRAKAKLRDAYKATGHE